MAYDAVLMLGFGGPGSMKEVLPFVMNVVRGRPVPPERIEQVVDQYRQIGGRSPFRELTERQARALASALSDQGLSLPVYVGLLFSPPYIGDTIRRMAGEGLTRAIAVVMAPHRSEASFDRYCGAVHEAVRQLDEAGEPMTVDFVEPWHQHPLFVEAVASRVSQALDRIDKESRRSARLLFTAHSIPQQMSEKSDYSGQVAESAELVAQSLGRDDWTLAFQSRSGPATQQWLGPDVRDAIVELSGQGVKDVVLVPLGFLCDHVEVLYDLDLQAAAVATEHEINMVRAATVGDHPRFIQLLAELVTSAASRLEADETED